jgi:Domain of unknown function (DUF932)
MINTPSRSRVALTRDQMMRFAPSIFATEAHVSRSDRYVNIPTINILEGLEKEGFEVVEVSQSKARDASRVEFTKHVVKMRRGTHEFGRPGEHVFRNDREEIPEVCLVNSHDGSSSYQMFAGLFRLLCNNGLMVASGVSSEIRIPHTGDVLNRVIEGAYTVVGDFAKVRDNAERMKALTLDAGESAAFARAAIVAKYGDLEEGKAAYPITAEQALTVRRHGDQGADLWRTFNRVQENLVKGGQRAARTATGRRSTTRPVAGITQNVQLNRALWTLADEMAKLKAA